jgi:hypothetical protein
MNKHRKILENRRKENQASTMAVVGIGMLAVGISQILPEKESIPMLLGVAAIVVALSIYEIFNKPSNHEPNDRANDEIRDTSSFFRELRERETEDHLGNTLSPSYD